VTKRAEQCLIWPEGWRESGRDNLLSLFCFQDDRQKMILKPVIFKEGFKG